MRDERGRRLRGYFFLYHDLPIISFHRTKRLAKKMADRRAREVMEEDRRRIEEEKEDAYHE